MPHSDAAAEDNPQPEGSSSSRKRERSPDDLVALECGNGEDSSSNEPPVSKPKLDPFSAEEGEDEEEVGTWELGWCS